MLSNILRPHIALDMVQLTHCNKKHTRYHVRPIHILSLASPVLLAAVTGSTAELSRAFGPLSPRRRRPHATQKHIANKARTPPTEAKMVVTWGVKKPPSSSVGGSDMMIYYISNVAQLERQHYCEQVNCENTHAQKINDAFLRQRMVALSSQTHS